MAKRGVGKIRVTEANLECPECADVLARWDEVDGWHRSSGKAPTQIKLAPGQTIICDCRRIVKVPRRHP
jgi:hypothetical protein